MPCFRGLELSICTYAEPGKLPEFPHPDASSVRLLSSPNCSPSSKESNSSLSSLGDPARVQKANPRVSVYIPSLPGSQFWIDYAVERSPEPSCFLFFKMIMNGTSVTTWGIDPAEQPEGSVKRALYEPSARWHFEDGGQLVQRTGIEARYFHFLPASGRVSVAEDGGLIEVQVFRARGRKRRAPTLSQHRGQESYGIAAPSGGLLDRPEEAIYYDWLLIDAKDSPFACYRFHYRSWINLKQLSLIPPFWEPRSFNNRRQSHPGWNPDGLRDRAYFGDTLCTRPFEIARGVEAEDRPVRRGLNWGCNSDTTDQTATSMALHLINTNNAYRRPLPEVPDTPQTVRKSFESSAPSITPSLLPFIEEEVIEVDDVVFGMAMKVPLRLDGVDAQDGEQQAS